MVKLLSRTCFALLLAFMLSHCAKEAAPAREKLELSSESVAGASVFVVPADELPKLERSARQGDSEAAYKLALHYGMTDNTLDGWNKSFYWYGVAADLGHLGAIRALSEILKTRFLSADECKQLSGWRDTARNALQNDPANNDAINREEASSDIAVFEAGLLHLCSRT